MIKYLLAFSVYTLAMIGIIVIAFLVWKNAVLNNNPKKKGSLKVEEALSLNARKTLYVIKIKDERFLIAADVDKTTFLAKLNDNEDISNNDYSKQNIKPEFEREIIGPREYREEAKPTMRNILRELTKNKAENQ